MPSAAPAPHRGPAFALPAPAIGTTVEVAPGIVWLRLRLPFALDHVNVWLLDDGDGWTVIDTGFADDGTRAIWEGLDGTVFAGKPVCRVLVTHFHPDHMGLAGWLQARTDAEFLTAQTEWLTGRMLALDTTDAYVAADTDYARRAGFAPELVAARRQRGNMYRKGVSVPPARYTRLRAGSTITVGGSRWDVMIGRGHAPEMITLYCAERGILVAADQILPRISPNIAVWPAQPDADPLRDFLETLPQYLSLPEDTFVLPSHDRPFYGLHARVRGLASHHDERLVATLDACGEPASAVEVMQQLFKRPLDPSQMSFAIGETLAHLNRLLHDGQIAREADADGVDRYRRSCPAVSV